VTSPSGGADGGLATSSAAGARSGPPDTAPVGRDSDPKQLRERKLVVLAASCAVETAERDARGPAAAAGGPRTPEGA
jgi:hypothetical protein